MSVEASTGVLDVRSSYGEVPIVGTVGAEVFRKVFAAYREHTPPRSLVPAHDVLKFGILVPYVDLRPLLDCEAMPETEELSELVMTRHTQPEIGFSMLRAMRPMLDIVAVVPGVPLEKPWSIDGTIYAHYKHAKTYAKLWHPDAVVPEFRRHISEQFVAGYPTGPVIDTGGQFGREQLEPYLDQGNEKGSIENIDALVRDHILPEQEQHLGAGEVGQLGLWRLHKAPKAPAENNSAPARVALRVSV